MKLKISTGSVPPGLYAARLTSIEPVTNEQYGPGIQFKFTVARGPFANQAVFRTTGCSPSPKNSLGKLLSGMLGRTLNVDEEIEVDDLVGRDFMVMVGVTETGGSRVESASPPPID
jgi:hypothetical protein